MAIVKSYTDLEQSKKLAEILLLESADMYWRSLNLNGHISWSSHIKRLEPPLYDFEHYAPCWSLTALLSAVNFSTINLHYDNARIDWVASATIHDSTKHCTKYESTRALNPVDACYEMILKLHELKML